MDACGSSERIEHGALLAQTLWNQLERVSWFQFCTCTWVGFLESQRLCNRRGRASLSGRWRFSSGVIRDRRGASQKQPSDLIQLCPAACHLASELAYLLTQAAGREIMENQSGLQRWGLLCVMRISTSILKEFLRM